MLEFNHLKYDLALENIDSAIAYNPENVCFYSHNGYILKEKKDYKAAMSCLEKTFDCNYSNGQLYLTKGEIQLAMGNYQSAINYLDSSININGDSTSNVSLNVRGYAYFLNKQYKEAIADYDSAVIHSKKS